MHMHVVCFAALTADGHDGITCGPGLRTPPCCCYMGHCARQCQHHCNCQGPCDPCVTQPPCAAAASPSLMDEAQLLLQPAAALLWLPHLQAKPQQNLRQPHSMWHHPCVRTLLLPSAWLYDSGSGASRSPPPSMLAQPEQTSCCHVRSTRLGQPDTVSPWHAW
jgi:hypothetical protein